MSTATPPPALASTPTPVPVAPVPKLTSTARLLLLLLARSPRPLTQMEIMRYVPCSAGSASQITRDLVAAGLLVSYPPEFGLRRVYTTKFTSREVEDVDVEAEEHRAWSTRCVVPMSAAEEAECDAQRAAWRAARAEGVVPA